METTPLNIPGQFKRSQSTQLSSLVLSSSYFCASSLHHPRNSGVTFSVPVNDDPSMERKLSRTRQMSETTRMSGASQRSSSRRMTTIPTVKEDINPQWITMLINQRQLKSGQSPLDPDVLEGLSYQVHDCKKSVGEFSSTYKLEVFVPGLNEKFGFVIKMIPDNDRVRAYVFQTGLFEKENEVYFDLIPAIKFYANQRKMDHQIDQCIPQCIYGSHNMDGAGVLVFNCCGQSGYKEYSHPSGLKVEQVKSVFLSIAEFHAAARSFVTKHGLDGVQRRYPCLCQDMYSNGMLLKEINDCIESFELFLDAISTNKLLLEDDLLEIKLQFAKLKSCDSFLLLKNLRRPSKVGKLTTIVHGELWDRNVLLNDTYQVIVLDWKNAKLASATLDLAFLMLSSTTWDLREDATDDLLQAYYERYCEKLACPDEEPTFQELQEDYRISLQIVAIQALCMFVQEMHYMTQNIAKAAADEDFPLLEQLSTDMKVYELRALTLFKDLDLSQIEEDVICFSDDMIAGNEISPSSFDEF